MKSYKTLTISVKIYSSSIQTKSGKMSFKNLTKFLKFFESDNLN